MGREIYHVLVKYNSLLFLVVLRLLIAGRDR